MQFLVGLIFIGFIIYKVKNSKQQGNKSIRQRKRELKQIEQSKIQELNNKGASRKIDVAGVTFEDRQDLINTIASRHGSEGLGMIDFIPEPDNKHDPNAIKIMFEDIGHIGYVPKERTASIKSYIDKNNYDIKWNINYIFDEDDIDDEGINYIEVRFYTIK